MPEWIRKYTEYRDMLATKSIDQSRKFLRLIAQPRISSTAEATCENELNSKESWTESELKLYMKIQKANQNKRTGKKDSTSQKRLNY